MSVTLRLGSSYIHGPVYFELSAELDRILKLTQACPEIYALIPFPFPLLKRGVYMHH
jgi:hypothetical protein